MKKKWFFGIAYLLLFVQLAGCSKSLQEDQPSQNSESLQIAKLPRAPIPTCRIEKITSWVYGEATEVAKFYYNEWGNPIRVEVDQASTGRPNLTFSYDNKNRLTDYLAPYQLTANGAYEFWSHYQYDRSGARILIDTSYLFGSIVNGVPQPNPAYKSCSNYEYDAQGRVSRVTRTFLLESGPPYPVTVNDYRYDAGGNLIDDGTYDYRTNLHRAHAIWQFIDRDYSINNPATAEKYNLLGYPLQFNNVTPSAFTFLSQIDLNRSEIIYKCPIN